MKIKITNKDGDKPIAKFEPGMRATMDMDTGEVEVLGLDEPFPEPPPGSEPGPVVVRVDPENQSVTVMLPYRDEDYLAPYAAMLDKFEKTAFPDRHAGGSPDRSIEKMRENIEPLGPEIRLRKHTREELRAFAEEIRRT